MNEIRKSHRSAFNRIQSIIEDAEYVSCVYDTYKKPLVPNKRCGLWYVKPEDRNSESYFKSTDGHTGQWSFSLKRLNLHLLSVIEEFGGIILVDSTRRGKVMPDALSKTIPIWCAVLNCALFGSAQARFPKDCVSASEQDLIESRIRDWAEVFKSNVPAHLIPKLSKPLKPIWLTPNSPLPMHEFQPEDQIFEDAHAVILCTASHQAQDGQIYSTGYSYVQGAADDHELWAPAQFSSELLWSTPGLREPGLGDEELLRRINVAIDGQANHKGDDTNIPSLIKVHPYISVGHASISSKLPNGLVIDLRSGSDKQSANHWPLTAGKRGSKQLGYALAEICELYECEMQNSVVVISDPGTDFAECVALMLDCRYFEPSGNPRVDGGRASYVTKEEVTRRNLSIIARSGSAPSRTTQNIIGSFLRK